MGLGSVTCDVCSVLGVGGLGLGLRSGTKSQHTCRHVLKGFFLRLSGLL